MTLDRAIQLRFAVLAVVLVAAQPRAADACKTTPPCGDPKPLAHPDTAATKLRSTDDRAMLSAAITLARSTKADQLEVLGRGLRTHALIVRIFAADRRCGLLTVVRALAANPAPQARVELAALIASREWIESAGANRADDTTRESLQTLLAATALVRPPSPEVIAMWTRLSQPHDGWTNVTATALIENGTPEAIVVLEKLFTDPDPEVADRADWLHRAFMANRQNLALLELARRLHDAKQPPAQHKAVNEGVFVSEHRREWYATCPGPQLVPRSSYTPAARAVVRTIAAKARALHPDKQLTAAIDAAIAELDAAP